MALHEQILDGLDENWRDHPADVGNAAVAITATVLETGRADLSFLRERTGFLKDALSIARDRLRANEIVTGKATESRVHAAEDEIESGTWWALLGVIGMGFIERTATDAN